jgi:hypothetical protein
MFLTTTLDFHVIFDGTFSCLYIKYQTSLLRSTNAVTSDVLVAAMLIISMEGNNEREVVS